MRLTPDPAMHSLRFTAMTQDIGLVFDDFALKCRNKQLCLFCNFRIHACCMSDGANGQMIPAHVITHEHIKGSGCCSLLNVAVDMEAVIFWTVEENLFYCPGISMERKDNLSIWWEHSTECRLTDRIRIEWGNT